MTDHPRPEPWREARDEAELAELRHHWSEAYSIMHNADGWQAKRRDGRGGWIIRPAADELFEAIRADYRTKPVRRDDAGDAP
jgi:hypothetical protein